MPKVFLSCDQWLFQSCDQILKPAGWTGPKMGLNVKFRLFWLNVKFRLFWVFRITGTKHAERALGRSSRSLLNPPPREEDLPSAQTFKHTHHWHTHSMAYYRALGSFRNIPWARMYWIYVIYCCLSCSGVLKLSSTFCESLADADAAALKRLRFAQNVSLTLFIDLLFYIIFDPVLNRVANLFKKT